MTEPVKRRYHAPRRVAAAAQTRLAILEAAKRELEARGWAGSTIRAIASAAEVSPKTVESLFSPKAALLAAVVDFAFRGGDIEIPVVESATGREVEIAPDTATMLARYAEHVVAINARTARLAAVVESAAASDDLAGELWARMTRNRRFGARWAAEALLAKPDVPPDLGVDEVEAVFLVGLEPATYRTLTGELGFTDPDVGDWLLTYYTRMLFAGRA